MIYYARRNAPYADRIENDGSVLIYEDHDIPNRKNGPDPKLTRASDEPRLNPLRVSVVGTSCSGKTTLAGKLAAACDIPHIELDAINWQPGWKPLPVDEFRRRVSEIVIGERWVIDGNYSAVRDLVWERVTDVVWLDLPFRTVLWRAVRRTSRRVFTGEELFGGNRETIRNALFERDAIIYWVIRTHRRRQREYSVHFGDRENLPFRVHHIRGGEDEWRCLSDLQKTRFPTSP